MNRFHSIQTPRLLLRAWRSDDARPFADMNTDQEVMHHFPAHLTRAESDAMIDRIMQHFVTKGWGLWAIEIPELFFSTLKLDEIVFFRGYKDFVTGISLLISCTRCQAAQASNNQGNPQRPIN
ncbi:GNAT family N-acetyltransferase [Spirosoma sp. HMF3257]|uniref:N-acetyltransferase domain-containing protein n=1 Tax=Spirosoma telluris TaxID=2183553 RepID=A0A327NRK1_9BACT|nr:GNAT family N-acetyltransferase [Spirosoma telluris]RAI77273.1 hypothetical protein HMF3257_29420 [Spirosoma telluris]